MLAQKNLYAELRLLPSANASEIRTAYRRAALLAHPDKGGSLAAFHSITFAYEILSCPASRELYDQSRGQWLHSRFRHHRSEIPEVARAKVPQCTENRVERASLAKRRRKVAAAKTSKERQRAASAPCGVEVFVQPQAGTDVNEKEVDDVAPTKSNHHGTLATLMQLRNALQALVPAQRKSAIMQMAPRVREELLAHMSSQQTLHEAAAATSPGGEKNVRKRGGQGNSWCRGTDIRAVRHMHKTIYQVQLRLRHLRMYTRGQVDIDTAISHQMLLVRARHAVDAVGEEIWDEPRQFCDVFTNTLTKAGASLDELGLSVFIFMRADEWICRCATITSPVLALEDAVAAHSRLLLARRTSWAQLRTEWVFLMRQTQRARLQQLSQAQAEALADRARQGLVERQLKTAVRAIERAISCRVRQEQRTARTRAQALRRAAKEKAAVGRRAARERRKRLAARRRWYCRVDLTMQEIMQGAPPQY